MSIWRDSNKFVFLFKKSNHQENTKKNICESVTYEDDLVKFSFHPIRYETLKFNFKKSLFFEFNMMRKFTSLERDDISKKNLNLKKFLMTPKRLSQKK